METQDQTIEGKVDTSQNTFHFTFKKNNNNQLVSSNAVRQYLVTNQNIWGSTAICSVDVYFDVTKGTQGMLLKTDTIHKGGLQLCIISKGNSEHLNTICSKVVYMIKNDVPLMIRVNPDRACWNIKQIAIFYCYVLGTIPCNTYGHMCVYINSYLFSLYLFNAHNPWGQLSLLLQFHR